MPRLTRANHLAARAHEGQRSKGTSFPYIIFPVAAAGLAAQFDGEEDQQIAGLLHDVLLDGGQHFAPLIAKDFGPRVLAIVEGCTDGTADATGAKAPSEKSKRAYLEHLADAADDVLLVSGCDKLSNARAILDDLLAIGPAVFDRFTAKKAGTLWYYNELAGIFTARQAPMASALAATVNDMRPSGRRKTRPGGHKA